MDHLERLEQALGVAEGRLERHVDWHTHKDPAAGGCPICDVVLVARYALRIAASLDEHVERLGSGDVGEAHLEDYNIEGNKSESAV